MAGVNLIDARYHSLSVFYPKPNVQCQKSEFRSQNSELGREYEDFLFFCLLNWSISYDMQYSNPINTKK